MAQATPVSSIKLNLKVDCDNASPTTTKHSNGARTSSSPQLNIVHDSDVGDVQSPVKRSGYSPPPSQSYSPPTPSYYHLSDEIDPSQPPTKRLGRVAIPPEFNRTPSCAPPLPPLAPSPHHTLLFRPHVIATAPPRPYPVSWENFKSPLVFDIAFGVLFSVGS